MSQRSKKEQVTQTLEAKEIQSKGNRRSSCLLASGFGLLSCSVLAESHNSFGVSKFYWSLWFSGILPDNCAAIAQKQLFVDETVSLTVSVSL